MSRVLRLLPLLVPMLAAAVVVAASLFYLAHASALSGDSTPARAAGVTPSVAGAPFGQPVRGQSGDLWADVILGKADFSQIAPGEIVPYKAFNPGGVAIDRSVVPGRAYVWDAGNSRILGIDLEKCYAAGLPDQGPGKSRHAMRNP